MSLELLCVNYGNFYDARNVLTHCKDLMKFDKVTLCHPNPFVNPGINVQQVFSKNQITCWFKEIPKIASCDHILSVQWDGFIINPEMWDESWLQYDWLGAVWPLTNLPNPAWRMGGGGFMLMSKRIIQAWGDICNDHENFDWQVAALYRDKFEALGMKYAPVEIAIDFSKECELEDIPIEEGSTFGFHGFEYGDGYREQYRKRVNH